MGLPHLRGPALARAAERRKVAGGGRGGSRRGAGSRPAVRWPAPSPPDIQNIANIITTATTATTTTSTT
eukprot:5061535-Heterocapsa_arctica.AAC.1